MDLFEIWDIQVSVVHTFVLSLSVICVLQAGLTFNTSKMQQSDPGFVSAKPWAVHELETMKEIWDEVE